MINLEFILQKANDFVWGPPLLFLLTLVGLLYTIRLKGLQFRYFFTAHKLAFSKDSSCKAKGDLSNFQTLMTMLAGTIGIGSITGIATALTIGGVGSLFWMWVAAAFGMATKYAESVLAIRFRITDKNGSMSGGPMYYIEKGFGKKWLACVFAFLAIMTALFGMGNMIQSNSVAMALIELVDLNPLYTGLSLAVLMAFSLFGGIKYLGKVSAILVPAMALFYIVGGLVIVFYHVTSIPSAFVYIFKSAFGFSSAAGGFAGAGVMYAIQMGISRGVFSSEAGLGSSPIVAAAAKTNSAAKQGLSSMCSVFITTGIVCTITGLVIVLTGSLGALDKQGALLDGSALVMHAFDRVIPYGGLFVTIAIIPFAFSTMMSWAYFGEKCTSYLFGTKSIIYYRIVYIILVVPGAMCSLHAMWNLANLLNGLMAFPNLIVLFCLGSIVVEETKTLPLILPQKKPSLAKNS